MLWFLHHLVSFIKVCCNLHMNYKLDINITVVCIRIISLIQTLLFEFLSPVCNKAASGSLLMVSSLKKL